MSNRAINFDLDVTRIYVYTEISKMINIMKYPKLLAFLRYILSWRAWKLNILEQIAFYCAVYLHKDILTALINLGSLFKGVWPQTIKEHDTTTSDKNAYYYIYSARLEFRDVRDDILIPFLWLSKYTDLDATAFKKWVDTTYPQKHYNKVHICAADIRTINALSTLIVDLEKNTWLIHEETEESDIMFDAFPLFTKQNI